MQLQVVLINVNIAEQRWFLYYLWTEVALVLVLVESTIGYTINPRLANGKKTNALAKSWTANLKL